MHTHTVFATTTEGAIDAQWSRSLSTPVTGDPCFSRALDWYSSQLRVAMEHGSGNLYCVTRHAKSLSNQQQILLGGGSGEHADPVPADASTEFLGAFRATFEAYAVEPHRTVLGLTSPLPRARQSAELVREFLSVHGVASQWRTDDRLQDRSYGVFEGMHYDQWGKLKESDIAGRTAALYGAEPPAGMVRRAGELLLDLETRHRNTRFIIITHADLMQIIDLLFCSERVSHYSERGYVGHGEGRWYASPEKA